MYSFESRVRFSEVNEKRELTLVSMCDYFQDASTFHSEQCGCGFDFLQPRNMAWMVLAWQVQVLRRPVLGEKIVSCTWPYAFKAFYGYRNYALKDGQGRYLAKANSVWALIDVTTGHPVKVLPEYISGFDPEPRLDMPEYPRKIQAPKDGIRQEAFPVVRSQLDTNHHVNNGQYIQMAEAYLPEDFEPGFLRVEYRKQARLHDIIAPLVHMENDTYTVSLCDTERKPYAVVAFSKNV